MMIIFLVALVITLGVSCVCGADLYPYGLAAGDETVTNSDDTTIGPLNLTMPFIFYQNRYSQLYISTDGSITFSPTTPGFRATTDPLDIPALAAFWSDLVLRLDLNAFIHYRISNDRELLKAIGSDVTLIGGELLQEHTEWAAVITWENVPSVGGTEAVERNTFQVVLTADCVQSFAIFLYNNISWVKTWTGDYAVAGFNAGLPYHTQTLLSGSGTDALIDLDTRVANGVGVPGKFVYRVDRHKILSKTCHVEQHGSTCTNDARCYGVDILSRVNCGRVGISRTKCEEKGCCYDNQFWGALWCFYQLDICDINIRSLDDPACLAAVQTRQFKPCINVRKRIHITKCLSMGCCWNKKIRTKNRFCYLPK